MATSQFRSSAASTIAVKSTAGASVAFPVWMVEIHLPDGTRRFATLDAVIEFTAGMPNLTGAGISAGELAGDL